MIEINKNSAVPSNLCLSYQLGTWILLNVFELPRSTALVGGITLSLMTLPRIIIPARASLKSVPPSIREGALGRSKVQTVFDHVVPLVARDSIWNNYPCSSIGGDGSLLLIGMVAFVVELPGSPMDPSASLPVQVYLWSESAERGFRKNIRNNYDVTWFFNCYEFTCWEKNLENKRDKSYK